MDVLNSLIVAACDRPIVNMVIIFFALVLVLLLFTGGAALITVSIISLILVFTFNSCRSSDNRHCYESAQKCENSRVKISSIGTVTLKLDELECLEGIVPGNEIVKKVGDKYTVNDYDYYVLGNLGNKILRGDGTELTDSTEFTYVTLISTDINALADYSAKTGDKFFERYNTARFIVETTSGEAVNCGFAIINTYAKEVYDALLEELANYRSEQLQNKSHYDNIKKDVETKEKVFEDKVEASDSTKEDITINSSEDSVIKYIISPQNITVNNVLNTWGTSVTLLFEDGIVFSKVIPSDTKIFPTDGKPYAVFSDSHLIGLHLPDKGTQDESKTEVTVDNNVTVTVKE